MTSTNTKSRRSSRKFSFCHRPTGNRHRLTLNSFDVFLEAIDNGTYEQLTEATVSDVQISEVSTANFQGREETENFTLLMLQILLLFCSVVPDFVLKPLNLYCRLLFFTEAPEPQKFGAPTKGYESYSQQRPDLYATLNIRIPYGGPQTSEEVSQALHFTF